MLYYYTTGVIGASEASPFLVCRRDFVCVSVCLSTLSWTGTIFAFVTRDPYPFNFADELGVSNFAELAPHNGLSIPLVIIIINDVLST